MNTRSSTARSPGCERDSHERAPIAEGLAEAAAAAAALGPLRLAGGARNAADQGAHARRRAGAGTEFWQYRPLEPGESIARADWRRSARSDTLFAREREATRAKRLWLWVDGSGSMAFASRAALPTKLARARLIAAALGLAARAGGEWVGVDGGPPVPSASALMGALGTIPAALPPLAAVRAGDTVVALGDFLDAPASALVAATDAARATLLLVAVADPAERDFPFAGAVRFEPVEPHAPLVELPDAATARVAYLAAWRAHVARLDALAAPRVAVLHHGTDTPAAATLAAAAAWLRG